MNICDYISRIQNLVEENGDKTMFVEGSRRTTRREFLDLAYRVNAGIRQKGISGGLIPIVLPSNSDYLAAEIGIWMSGNASVHLGDFFPEERVKYIAAVCEASLIIDGDFIKSSGQCAPDVTVAERNPQQDCVMFFTSGSTGNPKGVLHSDLSYMTAILRANEEFLTGPAVEVGGSIAPFYFVAVISIMGALYSGSVIDIVDRKTTLDINKLKNHIIDHGIEAAFLSPSLLSTLNLSELPLKLAITGSERVTNISSTPNCQVWNFYGQTEQGSGTLGFYIDKPYDNTPVGRPFGGVVPIIVDEQGKEVPQGEEGELCFKNLPPCKYYKDPERTAELMRGGIFHTGDIFRQLPSGDFLYVNRKDWMVKINGQRVEPGEVEAVMRKIDGIAGAVVKGFDSEVKHSQYLCAYYIPDAEITEEDIRLALEKKLPEYMVPSYFVRMEKFPLSATGKIDRKVLQAPAAESLQAEYAAPSDEVEAAICEAFSKVLKIGRVGVDDDFFRLGGDSIRIMQLQKECSQYGLSNNIIFNLKTPRRIAAYCRECASAGDSQIEKPDYPLSLTQLGIYLECQKREGEAIYNNPFFARLGENVDLARLAEAVSKAVEAHASLRTRLFTNENGEVRQKLVDDKCDIKITHCTEEELSEIKKGLVRPFLLLKDKLFRAEIFQTETGKYIFIDFHHIIFDGTSFGIFMSDLENAYNGGEVEAETYTHLNVADEEEFLRGTDALEAARSWYHNEFSGLDVDSLPSGDRNGAEQTFGRARTELGLTLEDAEKACAEQGASLNILSNAAWGYLLGVYGRKSESLYATVYNGRNSLKTERTMGMLVKTLPVHCVWNKESSVREYLQSVKDKMLGAMSNDIYSFAEASSELGVVSDILFTCQTTIGREIRLCGEPLSNEPLEHNSTGVMLDFELFAEDGGSLYLRAEYDASRFSEGFIGRMSECYRNILVGMLKAERLAEISLVTEEEKEHLIAIGAGERLDYDRSETFVDQFRKQAEKTPDSIAVVDCDSSITYRELDARSNALAHVLIGEGVKPEDFVCVMLPRRKEFVICTLGIMKAGAAYVPVDPEYPEDRKRYMMEDSGAQVVITSEWLKEHLHPDNTGEGDSAGNVPVNLAKPDILAYMIYTSGSTGRPKGTMIPHSGMRHFMEVVRDMEGLTGDDRIGLHGSFSFDSHVEDTYPVLTVGGSLHIMPEDIRIDIDSIKDFIVNHGITGGIYTTAIGSLLIRQYPELPMRFIALGGEKLERAFSPTIPIINEYGPTECTVASHYYEIAPGTQLSTIPIGRTIADHISFIVDRERKLVPQGVVGELLIAGEQVGRGYWHRPELTSEKFVECPYVKNRGGKPLMMYSTGDLCRWNAEGQLEYVGRIDTQVKLRGFRIELGEIENSALKFEGMKQAVAEVRNQQICLYYAADIQIDEAMLKEHLSKTLAEYMVPTAYICMEALPLTPNGKVDRKALPEPDLGGQEEYVEPSGEVECTIAEAFGNVLGVKSPVGALDSFFSLGGDSIKAIRLVSYLRQQGIEVTVADIMRLKTVRDLASGAHFADNVRAAGRKEWSGPVPDSAIVDYFFRLQMTEPSYFHQSVTLECRERMDRECLVRSFDGIVSHHDMLRAVVKDGHLYVRPVASGLWRLFEYTINGEGEISAICSGIKSSFDLENEGMMRVALFHLPDRDVMNITIHHLVVDGVSWRILLEDLSMVYGSYASGVTPVLPERTSSYLDYATALTSFRESESGKAECPYWQGVQKRLLSLPTSNGADRNRVFGHHRLTVPSNVTRDILGPCSEAYHTEVNDLLITALARAAQGLTGAGGLSLALEGHGREPFCEGLEMERTIGWFTSIYPVVIENLDGDLRHDIRTVKETMHRIPQKGFGYGPLMGHDVDKLPMMLFNYLGEMDAEQNADSPFRMTGIDTGRDVSPQNVTGESVSINGATTGGCMSFDISYDKAVYSAEEIASFANRFNAELESVATHCKGRKTAELTASDLGELVWEDGEFESVFESFKARGEELERIYPLTPMQEGMLLHHLNEPESAGYSLVFAYELDTEFSEDELRRVLDRLLLKHETLRTAIIYKGVSVPRQAVVKGRKPGLWMYDIRGRKDREAAVSEIRAELLEETFKDLQQQPLFGLACARTGSGSILYTVEHHIIADGWCTQILLRDLLECLLEERGLSEPKSVKPLPGLYEEYVRTVLGKDKAASLEYWKELLSGFDSTMGIPVIDSDDIGKSSDDTCTFDLDEAGSEALRGFCHDEQVTPSVVVELAIGILLGSYNYKGDAVFGKVVSGRDKSKRDMSEVMGLFINTIPVRVMQQKDMTVREAIRNQMAQSSESNPHDYCPLAEIQQVSGTTDLSDVILAFENYPVEVGRQEQVPFNIHPALIKEDHFNSITFIVFMNDEGKLKVECTYDNTKYGRKQMERMLDHLRRLIIGITANADNNVSSLKLLSDGEERNLMRFSVGEGQDYDRTMTVVDAFRHQVSLTPDNVALVFHDRRFTYRELDMLTDRLAAAIQKEYGITREDVVGVMIRRSELMVVYPLAVLKTGAAYMPLDPELPTDRLAYMTGDAGVKLILSDKELSGISLPGYEGEIISPDLSELPEGVPESGTGPLPESAFVILYTSGSTGKPKGVILEHHSLVNHNICYIRKSGLNGSDRVAAFAAFGFDMHAFEIFTTLSSGASLYVLDGETRLDLQAMEEYMTENGITVSFLTTRVGVLFMQTCNVPSLRLLSVAGEKLPPVQKPRYRLINGYGPTETTLYATMFEVEEDYDRPLIGVPSSGYETHIIDSRKQLVPQGVIGELLIGGEGVGRGYLNLPEQNAKRFITYNGKRAYCTGDLCRWNADGQLEYIGRIDTQVKLRGFRIEFGEIESNALKFDGIRQAVADVKNDQLCLYYTADAEIDEAALKETLSMTLTAYMVPEVYVRMEEFPLTPNGKVNRKVLPSPVVKTGQEAYVAPRNDVERQLCDAFAKLLGIGQVGIDDDFFSLGGNSLKLMSIQNACPSLVISTKMVFEGRTPRNIASLVENAGKKEHKSFTKDSYALNKVQTRYYGFCAGREGVAVFNVPWLLKIDNSIDLDRLASAVDRLVELQPALGARLFVDEQGEVRQRYVNPSYRQTVETTTDSEFESIKEQLCQPFRLLEDRLFRIRLFATESSKYLFFDVHHIIFDGVSIKVFLKDLFSLYGGENPGTGEWTFFELADENAELSKGRAFEEARAWYAEEFAGLPSEICPAPDRNGEEAEMTLYSSMIDVSPDAMRKVCEERSITMNTLVSAGAGCLIGRYCGNTDVLVQSMFNAREDIRSQGLIGCFAVPLVMRTKWNDSDSISDYLENVNRSIRGSMNHCAVYSVGDIVKDLNVNRGMPFIFQGSAKDFDLRTGGIILDKIEVAKSEHSFPINVHVLAAGDGRLQVSVYYLRNLYSDEFVKGFVRNFEVVMDGLTSGKRMSEIQISI